MKKFVSSKLFILAFATLLLQLSVLGIARLEVGKRFASSADQPKLIRSSLQTLQPLETIEPVNVLPDQALMEDQPVLLEQPENEVTLNETVVDAPLPETNGEPSVVRYKVKSGDTLTSIWLKNVNDSTGAIKAAAALKEAGIPLSRIKAGETLELKIAEDNTIEELTKNLGDGKKIVLLKNEAEDFDHKFINPVIIESQKTLSGTIFHSLSESASRNSVPAAVVDDFVDLFGGRVEFSRDLQPGDRFSVIFKERNCEDGLSLSPGPIEAASLVNGDDFIAVVRYEDSEGNVRYYDEQGEPIGSYFLRYPVRFTRISSVFSRSRFHPVLKRSRPHNGVDFAAPTGTPVRSVADGIIVKSGYSGGNGNMVKIKHSGRYSTAYLHLSKISSGIRVGTRVKRGQVIGKVGSTGLATGPHLHYSLYDHGRYVDPLKAELPKLPENQEAIPDNLLKTKLELLKAHHETLEMANASNAQEGIDA